MTENNQKRLSLREASRQIPTDEEFVQLSEEVKNVHDRSAAILLATQTEMYLEMAISSRFHRNDYDTMNDLTGRDGPLAGFYAKIQLAYAMGIIDAEVKHDLDIVRRVRNLFAHGIRPFTFDSLEVVEECDKWFCTETFIPVGDPDKLLALTLAGIPVGMQRQRYIDACTHLSLTLLSKIRTTHAPQS